MKYAGMIGLDVFEDGYVVGTCFPKNLRECKTYDLEKKYLRAPCLFTLCYV